MLLMMDSLLEPWFSYFQIVSKYSTIVNTKPLNIIFDEFRICFLGYITEF